MQTVCFTDAWHKTFGGGHVGILMMGPVENGRRPTALFEHKLTLVAEIREKYCSLTRAELQESAVLKAYKTCYRKFNKTYHVQCSWSPWRIRGSRCRPLIPWLMFALRPN